MWRRSEFVAIWRGLRDRWGIGLEWKSMKRALRHLTACKKRSMGLPPTTSCCR